MMTRDGWASAGVAAKAARPARDENQTAAFIVFHPCKGVLEFESGHAARSIRTGVWSEALSRPRISLSIVTDCNLSAACGDKSRWSIRMPLFFCQAPA